MKYTLTLETRLAPEVWLNAVGDYAEARELTCKEYVPPTPKVNPLVEYGYEAVETSTDVWQGQNSHEVYLRFYIKEVSEGAYVIEEGVARCTAFDEAREFNCMVHGGTIVGERSRYIRTALVEYFERRKRRGLENN